MCKGDTGGHYAHAAHARIERIRGYSWRYLIVVCKEVIAVIRTVDCPLGFDRRIAAIVMSQHIISVIHGTERRIHHDTSFNIIYCFTSRVGHRIGNIRHAVLIRIGAHQGNGLLEVKTVNRPFCCNSVVRRFVNHDLGASNSRVRIVTAEYVIPYRIATSDAERCKGRIERIVRIGKVGIVVSFRQRISLCCRSGKATVFLRNSYLEISVVYLNVPERVYIRVALSVIEHFCILSDLLDPFCQSGNRERHKKHREC